MKQLYRNEEPISFFKGDKKIDFYKDLKDDKGNIKARWNYDTYRKDLIDALLKMSDYDK